MIIKTIHLENWKLFREPVEVKFSEGLNIIYGPNESGKSTLIDSIRAVFFFKHTAQSEKIRSLVPWGSSLSPLAQIVFCQGDAYYRVTKRFISPQSTLEKLVDMQWQRIADGDEADRSLLELVGGKFSSRGDTKPELWGVGQVLWMVQGQPFVSEELNEETLSALQKLIGAAIELEEEKELFGKISARFYNVFTDKGKGIRKGSELWSIKCKMEELEQKKRELEILRVHKEGLIREIEDKETILQSKKIKLEAALKEREGLRQRVELARRHETERTTLRQEVEKISAQYKVLKERIDRIIDSKQKVASINRENEQSIKEKAILELELGNSVRAIELLSKNLEEVNQLIAEKENLRRFASIAHAAVLEEQKLQGMEKELERLKQLAQELEQREKKLIALKAPSREELTRIEEVYQRLRDARTKLNAIGLTVQVSAESDISGRIFHEEGVVEFHLEKGQARTWKAYQTITVQIDHIGEFEVTSGSEDVRKLKDSLEELEIAYEKITAAYKTRDVEMLRDLFQYKTEVDGDVKRLKEEMGRLSYRDEDALVADIAELKKRIGLNWSKLPDECEFKRYAGSVDKVVAQGELSRSIAEIEKEQENLKTRRKNIEAELVSWGIKEQGIRKRIREVEQRIYGNEERLKEIESSLDALQKDVAGLEELEKQLEQIALDLNGKEQTLRAYEAEIGAIEEEPVLLYEECERRIERLRQDIDELSKGVAETRGRLEAVLRGWKDPCILEEELEYCRNRASHLETEAQAIKLLYDLVHLYRNKAIESLTAPVQRILASDMNMLLGTGYESIKLDGCMKPVGVRVAAWKQDASLDSLSFGTQEQIWYLFRLALGRLLSEHQRELVVLDDPLANTDASRLHRALRILEDAAEKLQIIVVTCDPDKYNWLSKANFISLSRQQRQGWFDLRR